MRERGKLPLTASLSGNNYASDCPKISHKYIAFNRSVWPEYLNKLSEQHNDSVWPASNTDDFSEW